MPAHSVMPVPDVSRRARDDRRSGTERYPQHLGVDPDAARFREDLGADSLDASELLMAFEETFRIEIPDDEADPMQCVSDAIAYVEAQVAAGRPRGRGGLATDSATRDPLS